MKEQVLNDLFDYSNLKIYQIRGYFKFSLDSILLAEFVKISKNTKEILDMCSGNAPVSLILSTKTKAHIDAFELQKTIFELAEKSIYYNKLNSQISVYNADICEIDKYINLAKEAGAAVIGTGRSDYPNQINNALIFPGLFKGALAARAKRITEEMKTAAAFALAGIIKDEEMTSDYIIPSAFYPGAADIVAAAVEKAWKDNK